MGEFFSGYGLFLAKLLTFVVLVLLLVMVITALSGKGGDGAGRGNISITHVNEQLDNTKDAIYCLLYTSPSPRDRTRSRMPSSA